MAHYISNRELRMLERDLEENCGETGFRGGRQATEENTTSERERRTLAREKRKQNTDRRSSQYEYSSPLRQTRDESSLDREDEKKPESAQEELYMYMEEGEFITADSHGINERTHRIKNEDRLSPSDTERRKSQTRHKTAKQSEIVLKDGEKKRRESHFKPDEEQEEKYHYMRQLNLKKKKSQVEVEIERLKSQISEMEDEEESDRSEDNFEPWDKVKEEEDGTIEEIQKEIELLSLRERSMKLQLKENEAQRMEKREKEEKRKLRIMEEVRKKEKEEEDKRMLKIRLEELKVKEEEKRKKSRIMKERRLKEEYEQNRLQKEKEMMRLQQERLKLLRSVEEKEELMRSLARVETDSEPSSLEEDFDPHYPTEWRGELNSNIRAERKERTIQRNGCVKHGDNARHSTMTCRYEQVLEPKLPKLTEENFEEWKVEVEVMMTSDLYPKDSLLHCVRNSVGNASGNIRKVLPTIPACASTKDIIEKLDNIYGDRRPGESYLAEFYRAKQTPSENVAEWGIRLETILLKAWKKGQISSDQMDEMLFKRFWKYLSNEKLKLNTRHCFENCITFDELRKRVRMEENELSTDSDDSQKCVTKKKDSNIQRLTERVNKMER